MTTNVTRQRTTNRLSMRGMPYIMSIVGGGLGFGLRGPKPAVRGIDVAGTVEVTVQS